MLSPSLILPRKSRPAGLLARDLLQKERLREFRSRGIRDPDIDRILDRIRKRECAIGFGGAGGNASASDGVSSVSTDDACNIPANSGVAVLIKWEDAVRTPTIDGTNNAGVSNWSYLSVQSNGVNGRACYGVSSGANAVVTANFGSSTPWTEIMVLWFTGVDTVSLLDTSNQQTGSAATHAVAAVTNTTVNAAFIALFGAYGPTDWSSWSFGGTGGSEAWDGDTVGGGYLIVSSAASRNGQAARSGSDDYVGSLLVFAEGSTGNTGALAATYNALAASLSGDVAIEGSLSPTIAAVAAALQGDVGITGDLALTYAAMAAQLEEDASISGDLAATLPALLAALDGTIEITGDLAAQVPALMAALRDAQAGSLAYSVRRRLLLLLSEEDD